MDIKKELESKIIESASSLVDLITETKDPSLFLLQIIRDCVILRYYSGQPEIDLDNLCKDIQDLNSYIRPYIESKRKD